MTTVLNKSFAHGMTKSNWRMLIAAESNLLRLGESAWLHAVEIFYLA